MAYGDLYQVGTATLNGGDATLVTITGALLLGNVVAGDTFERAGRGVTIAEIVDDENLHLVYDWPDSAFEDVAYAIIQDSPNRNPPLALARNLRDQYERLRIFDNARPTFGVVEFGVDTPPEDYAAGDMLVIGDAPTDEFAGRSNAVARFTDENTWFIETPEYGWRVISETDPLGSNIVRTWDGSEWISAALAPFNVVGAYDGGTTYARNDLVEDQDQSWVYINATPGDGNAPPTLPTLSNSYWQWVTGKGEKGDTGSATSSADVAWTGDISPSSLSADVDDYNPSGLSGAAVVRVSSDAVRSIFGLQGGADGRLMTIKNVNTDPVRPIIIGAERASSTAAYRFTLSHDLWLWPGEERLFKYDATTSRWSLVGGQPLANHLDFIADPFPSAGVKPVAHANYCLKRLGVGEVYSGPPVSFTDAQCKWYAGATNVPAFDHDPVTGAFIGLRLPPASTNGLRNNSNTGAVVGVVGSGGNLGTDNSVSNAANLAFEVIGFGTDTDNNRPYIDVKISGTTNATFCRMFIGATTHFAAVQNDVVTASMGHKIVGGSTANITASQTWMMERNAGGTLVASTGATASPALSSRYAPISHTYTVAQATAAFVHMGYGLSFANGVAIDITIRFYFDNLEKHPYPTPRIPTTNAEVTRTAPTLYRDVGHLIGASGAMACKYTALGSAINNARLLSLYKDADNYLALIDDRTGSQVEGWARTGGSFVAQPPSAATVTGGSRYRACFGWNTDDFALSVNGATAVTDTSGALPASADKPTRLYIGNHAGGNHGYSGILGWSLFPVKPSNTDILAIAGTA